MVICESDLRRQLLENGERVVVLQPGDVVTPAAKDFLREHAFHIAGADKPEHMTHLRGTVLVNKTHPRIRFRGKLDTLQAFIIQAQVAARDGNVGGLSGDLGEVLAYARDILASEVKDSPFPRKTLFGLHVAELRSQSHNPEPHFGVKHTVPDACHGTLFASLNVLRTLAREAELACLEAVTLDDGTVSRPDLALAMNRLSSGLYILMCRLRGSWYGSAVNGE